MKQICQYGWFRAVGLAVTLVLVGCTYQAREQGGAPQAPASPPVAIVSGSRAVVENYLRAASQTDGAEMYALIASSERDDETPQSLKETAQDRYSASTMWEILKVEEKGSTSEVVVDIKGAKVDPNPYRFTLTKEAGEWRIVQSPELHEDDSDDLKIKF